MPFNEVRIPIRIKMLFLFLGISAFYMWITVKTQLTEQNSLLTDSANRLNILHRKNLVTSSMRDLDNFSYYLEEKISSMRMSEIQPNLTTLVQESRLFVYASLVTAKGGNVLATSTLLKDKEYHLNSAFLSNNNYPKTAAMSPSFIPVESYTIKEISVPLFDGDRIFGSLVVGLDGSQLEKEIGDITKDFNRRIISMRNDLYFRVFLLVIVVGVFVYFIVSRLSKPLEDLTLRMQEIKGDFFHQDPNECVIKSNDEIGLLSREFCNLELRLKESYQILSDVNRDQEKTINERTEELIESRDIAERANEAKSVFLATISHEIKTPINGILGAVQLIETNQLNLKQKRNVSIINTSAKALMFTVNDLLDSSRLESGQVELHLSNFSVVHIIDEAIDLIQTGLKNKNLGLRVSIAPNVPEFIKSDYQKLQQILRNLLNNALKFTSMGTISIFVSMVEEFLRISVVDTGSGVKKELQKSIFEQFTQGNSSTNRVYGGSGLGLNISQQLIHLLEGEIGIISDGISGSEFYFTVPYIEVETPVVEPNLVQLQHEIIGILITNKNHRLNVISILNFYKLSFIFIDEDMVPEVTLLITDDLETVSELQVPHVVILGHERPINCKFCKTVDFLLLPFKIRDLMQVLFVSIGLIKPDFTELKTKKMSDKKILLAEDHPINQEVFLSMLNTLGYTADIVENGEQAVTAVRNGNYDIIFMDTNMPVMSGLEATQLIRELSIPHVPIVAVTAYSTEKQLHLIKAVGTDEILEKPVEIESIKIILDQFVSGSTHVGKLVDLVWLQENLTHDLKKIKHYLSLFLTVNKGLAKSLLDRTLSIKERSDIVHRISGSSATLGLKPLATCARMCEEKLLANALEEADVLQDELIEIFAAVEDSIESLLLLEV